MFFKHVVSRHFLSKIFYFAFLIAVSSAVGVSSANAQQSVHITLGNPDGAVADINRPNNYLLVKPEFALSYNRSKGGPNWVSWHLDESNLGAEDRRNDFRPDQALPAAWRISQNAYRNTGYDRGHLCPSGDRTASAAANSATFVMSNMLPQEGDINRYGWAQFEDFVRSQIRGGREAYVIAGGYGAKEIIAGGRITVPTNFWKVVVLIPEGENDLSRISRRTRVIAIDMPNDEGLSQDSWREYLTSVDEIETETGYDLLSEVSDAVQSVIEARRDSGRSARRLLALGSGDGEGTGTRGGRTPASVSVTSAASNSATVTAMPDGDEVELTAAAAAETEDEQSLRLANEFGFSQPQSLTGKKTLWATNYYVYGDLRSVEEGGVLLLDKQGKRLGPELSAKDWCLGGVEGTFRVIDESDKIRVFNFAGTAGTSVQVDCKPFIRSQSINLTALGKSRYAVAKGEFGDGVGGMILVPYRTIAVDKTFLPYGSAVFIPAARGVTVTLPSGEKVVHDGYFFAADTGGAIKGNHIDVFTGLVRSSPFRFVQSSPAKTFEAYLVTDAEIVNALKKKHLPNL